MGVWAQAGVGGIKVLAPGPREGVDCEDSHGPHVVGAALLGGVWGVGKGGSCCCFSEAPTPAYPLENMARGQARSWAGGGEPGWGLPGVPGTGSGLPAPLPSLSPSILLGVPLLVVIPWGIVKYLYEDEG